MTPSDPHNNGSSFTAPLADAGIHAPVPVTSATHDAPSTELTQPKPSVLSATAYALPSTLTAARDAAAFVAQIFADSQAQTSGAPAKVGTAALPRDEAQESVPDNSVQSLAALAGMDPLPELREQPKVAEPLEQHVLILGLGASGLAMARWCVRSGAASVTVADTRAAPPQLATLQAELPQVRFVLGTFDAALLDDPRLTAVYRSPGLSPQSTALVLEVAGAKSLALGGEYGGADRSGARAPRAPAVPHARRSSAA